MFKKILNNKLWTGFPSWLLIGAFAVLLPIFAFTTAQNIQRWNTYNNRLLLEKGTSLIRSFEAGTRTGIMGDYIGSFHLHNLLTEIAIQPYVSYILITDTEKTIVAHDNPDYEGATYKTDIDLKKTYLSDDIQWHIIKTPDKEKIFEVYKKFNPVGGFFREGMMRKLFNPRYNIKNPRQAELVIFVGLDMSYVEQARKADTKHYIFMGIVLLLVGFAGVVLLFMTQSYKNTKASLTREIARSQRLASLGSLAAGVAHEIRNPLSSIKGLATYFMERTEEEEDKNVAKIMISEVDRLNRVVSQLVELARPVTISKQPALLKSVIENSIKLLEREALGKNIQIATNISSEKIEIAIDKDRITQVLLNLFLNAIESMEKGGKLTIDVFKKDKGVLIKVSDTGSGIDKDYLSQIFDPYFTTKSNGTGLGLAIVYNIIEAHDGKITAQSFSGKGTVFTIFLPGTK